MSGQYYKFVIKDYIFSINQDKMRCSTIFNAFAVFLKKKKNKTEKPQHIEYYTKMVFNFGGEMIRLYSKRERAQNKILGHH